MMGPSLFPSGGNGGTDPALGGRVDAVEEALDQKASTTSVDALATATTQALAGKASTGSVTAVAERVGTLEARPAGGRFRRVLIGIHPTLAGTAFNRSALLAEPWMSGVPESECDADLQLVGGGASGRAAQVSTANGSSFGAGVWPGDVRLVPGLRLADLVDGTAMAVGAGGAGSTLNVVAVGGTTTFGRWYALGGRGVLSVIDPSTTSDVPIGRPAITSTPATSGVPVWSQGPGAGGHFVSVSTDTKYAGGNAGHGDTARETYAGATPQNPSVHGQSAPAASFGFGAGGAGSACGSTDVGGNGGFPGGGGGATVGLTGAPRMSGSGGNGVIRIAVYRWVSA